MISLLGNVKDGRRIREILSTFGIQTVYHAAAYKHVPMVEHNVVEGLVEAYNTFHTQARPFINIANEGGYDEALDALEKRLETTSDSADEPLNPLIDMLSKAIERYENQNEESARDW